MRIDKGRSRYHSEGLSRPVLSREVDTSALAYSPYILPPIPRGGVAGAVKKSWDRSSLGAQFKRASTV